MNNLDKILDKIKLKLMPIVYLHSSEKYPPINFDNYIEQSKLKREKDNSIFKPEVNLTPAILSQYVNLYPELSNSENPYTLFLEKGLKSQIITNPSWDLENTPVYMHLYNKSGEYYLNVIFLYAYNGASTVFGLFSTGEHMGDAEHITYNFVLDGDDVLVKRIYFSAHFGGRWYWPDELEYDEETGRLIVYSAVNSHASYPHAETYYRFWHATKDSCEKYIKWDIKYIIDVDKEKNSWYSFRGDLGDGHVNSLMNSSWWNTPDETHNYGQNCCFSCK